MFLNIHELELHEILFDESLPPGRIDFGNGITQVEPLAVRGSAQLVDTEIHLQGSLQTVLEVSCDRCLEPVRRSVQTEFDLFYEPIQRIAKNEEVEITKDDLDIGFYHGDGLLLEDVVKEQVLLTLPMKNVCRPDCAGLCPHCGQNLNLGNCGCRPPAEDTRWSRLHNLST